MKKTKLFLAVAIAVPCISTSAIAWTPMPLTSCFDAVERGVMLKTFIKNDWVDTNNNKYHLRTDHIHTFYNGQIFDLYRDTNGAAFCEAQLLYQG